MDKMNIDTSSKLKILKTLGKIFLKIKKKKFLLKIFKILEYMREKNDKSLV